MDNIINISNIDNVNKKDSKIFIALSADYANIGDVAITLVQEKMINQIFPDRKLIEIPMIDYYKYKSKMQNVINKNDLITIIGGGNIGSVYIGAEERRRDIIKSFPDNKIISFPQSIDFEENTFGEKEFRKTINTYKKHSNLTIFSREARSYQIMKDNFKNKVILVPDTVLYLQNKVKNLTHFSERSKVLLCFRDDQEKTTAKKITEEFLELFFENNFKDVEVTDTHLGRIAFNPNEKDKLFRDMINNFKKAKLVVTDRLHGMIFALITKTPCIVFDNSNHKISSTYDTWLNNIPYIKILRRFEKSKILECIAEFSTLENSDFKIHSFDEKFIPLFDEIKNEN